MKRYSIFHIPAWSFFSKPLYRDVCHQWKGTGLAYLLLLLAICWIAPIIRLHMNVSNFVDNEAPKIVSQVPVNTIADGKASIDEPQPYYIQHPETGQNLIVIDTTGETTSPEDAGAAMLLTETELIISSEVQGRTVSLRDFGDFTLDQYMITDQLTTLKKLAAPIAYPFALLGSYIFRIVQLLIYAAIGMLFASWCKSQREYTDLLRLSAVAVTPCIIIKTLLGIAQVSLPVAGLWYFLAAMAFLFFGVKAASQEENPAGAPALPNIPREG